MPASQSCANFGSIIWLDFPVGKLGQHQLERRKHDLANFSYFGRRYEACQKIRNVQVLLVSSQQIYFPKNSRSEFFVFDFVPTIWYTKIRPLS